LSAITMQTVMVVAQSNGGSEDGTVDPITADEL
jgi:hypothetical protein